MKNMQLKSPYHFFESALVPDLSRISERSPTLFNPRVLAAKRILDVLAAGLGLLIFGPVMIILAALVRIDSPGPAFFGQWRVGKDGKLFRMWKFRTMRNPDCNFLEKYLQTNPPARQEWDRYQKLQCDPRLTRLGILLRRFSLDELPQLVNILTGEMSLVGPRPFLVEQRDIYGLPYRDYIRLRPGLTGLWQISGRNTISFHERVLLDQTYVDCWSIRLEFKILWLTLGTVLQGDGAY